MTDAPLLTVFTATFDRAHTLSRVYESLRAQTLQDFEWLLIDDGSTDGTRELVAGWARQSTFPIRYVWQPNAGKHVAHNRAVSEARGRFFTVLDSDDACVPNALERLTYHWETIPEEERAAFSGVGALCRDQKGALIGDRFPSSPFDADVRTMTYVFGIHGEKWGFQRTDLLRQFPFPEIAGTKFIPEVVVWNSIAKTYRIRWFNEPLRIYYVAEAGGSLSQRQLCDNAPGRLYYCIWLLNNDLSYFFHAPVAFLKAAVLLPILAGTPGQSFGQAWAALQHRCAKLLVALALPLSLLVQLANRFHIYPRA